MRHARMIGATVMSAFLLTVAPAFAKHDAFIKDAQNIAIPILGMTLNAQKKPVGVVVKVLIYFKTRKSGDVPLIHFEDFPGRFSPYTRQETEKAILRAADAAHLDPSGWVVIIVFPYDGITMYGDSLSAMVALSVVALAKGDPILPGRVLTGTITKDGAIGSVGGVPDKIIAGDRNHLERILIPEAQAPEDGDPLYPFLSWVSPVGTIEKAYEALTGKSLCGGAGCTRETSSVHRPNGSLFFFGHFCILSRCHT